MQNNNKPTFEEIKERILNSIDNLKKNQYKDNKRKNEIFVSPKRYEQIIKNPELLKLFFPEEYKSKFGKDVTDETR